MSKSVATTNNRIFARGGRGLRFTACILALAAFSAAAPSAFSADGDKDFEKALFALEQKDDEAAESFFAKAAGKGHAEAANRLGVIKHNKEQYEEAFKLFKQAVEQGFEPAVMNLAQYYSAGLGCERDYGEAFKLFLKLAEGGNAEAQTSVGAYYYEGKGVEKNEAEAVKWTKKAAEQGESGALLNLGKFHLWGSGVPKDEKEAFSLFKKAAEQGNEEAIYQLGMCYYNGTGTDKDKSMAAEYIKKAKDWMMRQGAVDSDIAFQLGRCLGWLAICANAEYKQNQEGLRSAEKETNENMRRNISEIYRRGMMEAQENRGLSLDAINAYTLAAEKGNSNAQYALASLCMIDLFLHKKNEKEAVQWFIKAAENGNVYAQYDLANYYMGIKKDDKVEKWLRMAADGGDVAAQWRLATNSKDEKEIIELTKKVASHSLSDLRREREAFSTLYNRPYSLEKELCETTGLIHAYCNLGNAYANGKGVEEDEAEAVKWFELAAAVSLEQLEKEITARMDFDTKKALSEAIGNAQYTLGVYYEKGWGVEKNVKEAIKWYKKAEGQEFGDAKKKAKTALERLGQK